MTTRGNVGAAVSARQEDQELTEIAQIAPGNTEKVHELLIDPAVPPDLLTAFEAAAGSATYAEKIETFNLQQQKTFDQQQQAEQKKEKEQRDSWLDSMSPEYQQAYGHLMTTVDNADKEYDQLRERLQQRGKALDDEAQDIDDNALHLSDGSRAYVNGQGVLVDANGIPLKGQEAAEAKAMAQQRTTPVATYASYQQNQQSRADVNNLSKRVDTEENEANKFKQDVADHKVPDTDKVQQGDVEIQKRLAATRTLAGEVTSPDTKASDVSLADLSDLDGDAPPATTAADRTSFASTVDDGAGIKASSLSVPFKAATQVPVPVVAPSPAQKPAAATPSPI